MKFYYIRRDQELRNNIFTKILFKVSESFSKIYFSDKKWVEAESVCHTNSKYLYTVHTKRHSEFISMELVPCL